MQRAGDWTCVTICVLALLYVLWHVVRAGWLF